MEFEKKASVEWTVGKLLTFILLILVLVLVIYGISTGGFKPLYSKVQGQINEVLIMLGMKDDDGGDVTCVVKNMNLDGAGEGVLTLCRGYCSFNFSESLENFFPSYLYSDGEIIPYTPEGTPYMGAWNWVGDADLGEKSREAYRTLQEVLKNLDFMPDDSEEKELYLTMDFMPDNNLQFNVGSWTIYRWEGSSWYRLFGKYESSNYSEDKVLSELYSSYINKQSVSWGYSDTGVDMIPLTEEEGASRGYVFQPIENEAYFKDWVLDKKAEWDMNSNSHEEGLKKLEENSKTVFVEYQNKKFPYHVSSITYPKDPSQTQGDRVFYTVPVIYFDGSNEVRWSYYYNVSEDSFQLGFGEKFDDLTYDIPAKMSEQIWARTKVLSEVNALFETYC